MLMGIVRRAWPYIAIVALAAISILLGRRVVAIETLIKVQQDKVKKSQEVKRAGDETPRSRDDVSERLRHGRF